MSLYRRAALAPCILILTVAFSGRHSSGTVFTVLGAAVRWWLPHVFKRDLNEGGAATDAAPYKQPGVDNDLPAGVKVSSTKFELSPLNIHV